MRIILTVIAVALLLGGVAVAGGLIAADHSHDAQAVRADAVNHGGGLDKCGGHNNRKTGEYHYHRGPYC